MHPYELQSIIRLTHKDDFLRLNPGSLYNSIDRLLESGLIAVAETTRSGRRPERTVYRITREGEDEALRWLRELLETPGADSTWFYAALSFLPALRPEEVSEQLTRRLVHLEEAIRNYRSVLRTVTPRAGRLNLIELEYALALRQSEARWVKQILRELRNGTLSWNPDQIRCHAASLFTTCLPSSTFDCSTHEPANNS